MAHDPAPHWRDFIEQHWERSPILWRGVRPPETTTSEELFRTIVSMPSRSTSDRFWAARDQPARDPESYRMISLDHFGPRPTDNSLAGFFARTRQELPGRALGINIHRLQLANPDLWFRFRRFIRGLVDGTGELPTQRWEIDTFLGTYEATPLGIHRDNASVFAFGVLGRRTYYFWPASAFEPGSVPTTLDRTQLAPHLQQAQRFDVGPGDVVYWPSSHWHLVTSNGEPSAVIQISAYFGRRLSNLIAQQVQRLLRAQLGESDLLPTFAWAETREELPQALTEAGDRVARVCRKGLLDDALHRVWLAHLTADGFIAVPAASTDARVDLSKKVAIRHAKMLAWRRTTAGRLIIAANGHTRTVDEADLIGDFLARVSCGPPTRGADLIKEVAGSPAPVEAVTRVLDWLHACRVLAYEDATPWE